ncbi:MAG TPA: hypothetical protein VKY71_10845 [Actinotalea caeni]|uniref:hypothetical protein n=1 Tax=Actinotalea caeni TaxID=1348467 RepID=UPI002B4B915D|nr:hypothetical protein [Actinotalea caeni]HLV56056.1 hypothetical protein [Actinotalea caeni]
MTQTVGAPPQQSLSELLGLGLLRTSARLLAAHWWQLLAVATCAYVAHHYLIELAVRVGRAGAVPGLLVFSLVPLVPLVAIVLMLLVLRERRTGGGGVAAFVAAIGSVLVPFLVVYESQGDFMDDLGSYFNVGFEDDMATGSDTLARTPEPTSPLVIAVVGVAFLLRVVGARAAERESLWRGGRRPLRSTLRALNGYAEVVWIVLGTVVVVAGLRGLRDWWRDRRLGRALADWWDGVAVAFPDLGALGDWLVTAVGTVTDGVVTGLVAPLAWLAIGVIVYGLSAAEGIAETEVVDAVRRTSGIGRVAQRVDPGVITLAWRRIADPEGRFGALLGGVAMILRSRFVPVLVFCVVYTVLTAALPYAVWEVARTVFTRFDYPDWLAAYGPLQALVHVLLLCLTAPLLAAWADALLIRFGARSQLRLPDAG